MKVTVCFGNTRVKVPCREDASIADLLEKACSRYKKAIGKDPSYGVHIVKLSAIDGAILDTDDFISDVVEDNEKLVATYEEDEPLQRDWDLGSMTSSEGKNTPPHPPFKSRIDAFSDQRQRHFLPDRRDLSILPDRSALEIDVDNVALKSSTHVMVLREPESSSTVTSPYAVRSSSYVNTPSPLCQPEHTKENGAVYDPRNAKNTRRGSKPRILNEQNFSKNSEGRSSQRDNYFRRDVATRQSMGSGLSESTTDNLYDAPSPYEYTTTPIYNGVSGNNDADLSNIPRSKLPWFYRDSQEITFLNDGSLKGIKVTSFTDEETKKFAGLLIESIAEVSSSVHGHSLTIGDVIVEINEHVLMDFAFDDAEAMLRESLKYPNVQFRVLAVEEMERDHPQPANSSQQHVTPDVTISASSPTFTNHASLKSSTDQSEIEKNLHAPKQPAVTQLSYDNVSRYTKKIGSRVNVQLKKEIHGLGFSLTSRDTVIGEAGPIYIKHILPKGAAIKDGRLLAGDRLLEVNGENVLGKTQEEVVTLLRAVSTGSVVNITVSRQSDTLPRKLKDDPDADKVMSNDQQKEYFLFDIPLNDTGSAGLGISLKGSQSKRTREDLGVFVKNVLHGGAAWQDGRLQPNDQLIEVNGHSLRNVSNLEAIDILRTSMSIEGNIRGMIEMVIARRRAGNDSSRISSEASSDFSDTILDQLQSIPPDINRSAHPRQSSMPSVLMETSFGPDDITDVTSISLHGSSTLGRPRKSKKQSDSIHLRSRSTVRVTDTLDVEVVNKVREKILSSSSSNFLGNLLRAPSPCPSVARSVGSGESYLTWTIPRTHRIPQRSLSLRSKKTAMSLTRELDVTSSELQERCAFESITAVELANDGPSWSKSDAEVPAECKISITSVTSSESMLNHQAGLPQNPNVVSSDEEWTDPDYEPFSRESTMRQSISEKRRDIVQRSAGELPKLRKSLSGEKKETAKATDQKKLPGRSFQSPIKQQEAMRKSGSNAPSKPNPQKNNNNSNYVWRVPQSSFHKSVSTESLVATAATTNIAGENKYAAKPDDSSPTDVGPNLGIAKSSSLESLQTALSSFVLAEKNIDTTPRSMTKVVRGRVLNDSFRAALDRSYALSQEMPKLNHMETLQNGDDVREEGYRHTISGATAPSMDGSVRSIKKRNKLFGLFKKPKPKKESENELHKKELEARKEQDFQKMQEEKERIEAKARELRIKQAVDQNKDKLVRAENRLPDYERPRPPSVPVTSMRGSLDDQHNKSRGYDATSGRHSVDPFSRLNHTEQEQTSRAPNRSSASPLTEGDSTRRKENYHMSSSTKGHHVAAPERPNRASPPPPNPRGRRRTKADNKKFKEASNAYSSLPSLLDIDALEDSANEIPLQVRRESSDDSTLNSNPAGSGKNISNRLFYNQQKPPNSRRKSSSKDSDKTALSSLFHSNNNGNLAAVHYHRREKSPEPPPQSFYVVQGTSPGVAVVRRGTIDRSSPQKPPSSFRHSIYTDQPTAFNYASQISAPKLYNQSPSKPSSRHKHVTDDVSSAESTSSEQAERNRRAYYKLMRSPHNDGAVEKIEVSDPYLGYAIVLDISPNRTNQLSSEVP